MRMVFFSHTGNHFAFYGFLGHQTHCPAGTAFRRVTAEHGDQTLFLVVIQRFRRSGPLLLVERPFQAAFRITMSNLPDGLRCERNRGGDSGRRLPPWLMATAPRHVERLAPVTLRPLANLGVPSGL